MVLPLILLNQQSSKFTLHHYDITIFGPSPALSRHFWAKQWANNEWKTRAKIIHTRMKQGNVYLSGWRIRRTRTPNLTWAIANRATEEAPSETHARSRSWVPGSNQNPKARSKDWQPPKADPPTEKGGQPPKADLVWRSQTRVQRASVWSQAYIAICTKLQKYCSPIRLQNAQLPNSDIRYMVDAGIMSHLS